MFVIALWPSHYPYSQAPQVQPQHQTENGIRRNDLSDRGPPSQTSGEQQGERGSKHVSDVTILGVKPGEWLLSIITLMLWGATVRLVREGKKTAERQLRAYVSIVGGHIKVIQMDSGHLYIRGNLELKNSGQTPAYKFAPWTIIDVLDSGIEPVERSESGQESIFGPGASSEVDPVKGPLDESTIQDIRKGKKVIWVWGEFSYTDTFGNHFVFEHRSRNGRLRQDGNSWPVIAAHTAERNPGG
jgi:hypothetical protein